VRKVLYVSHNHVASRPGGAEMYTHDLYEAVRRSGTFEPFMVSKVGPPMSPDIPHSGTRFALANQDPNEYYFYTRGPEFDPLTGAAHDKHLYTEDWRDFVDLLKPDLVHFQHANWLGFDMLRETRRALPNVPIVYTLHEFEAICHHNGEMVRTKTFELCNAASPRQCHLCFPTVSVPSFYLRERFVRSAFELVDLFIAPSEFLRRRYIAWGIPADKIRTEDYGRFPVNRLPDPPNAGRRKRIGFFGQLTEFKGVDVLLEAMKILIRDRAGVQLTMAGANIEIQTPAFQDRIRTLLKETASSVVFAGRYTQRELPSLLSAVDWVVLPSIWWENSPLVIQEAMMHRRPVICSNIGGMAEHVQDGVTGLHFRVRDSRSLAETIRGAVNNPALWDEMRGKIADPHSMDAHLETITDIYDELLARTSGAKSSRDRTLVPTRE
jgi:glycosyltransferase involved in cell wall biosynthesis